MTSFQKIINKELQNRNIISHGFFITMNEYHRVYQYMTYKKNSYTSQDDEITENIFFNIQRKYRALLKFRNICLNKIIKKFDYKYDLIGEIIDENIKTIEIIEDKIKYTFTIGDIVKIINSSLLNVSNKWIVYPHAIKNPYTNKCISLHNLYNIYFKLKESVCKMPILFEEYFKSEFNMKIFHTYNEPLIREELIKYNTKMLSDKRYIKVVNELLSSYKSITQNMQIKEDFPVKTLRKAFDPMIKLYLTSRMSLIESKRYMSVKILRERLKTFKKANPQFGRITMKRKFTGFGSKNRQYEKYYEVDFDPVTIMMPLTEEQQTSNLYVDLHEKLLSKHKNKITKTKDNEVIEMRELVNTIDNFIDSSIIRHVNVDDDISEDGNNNSDSDSDDNTIVLLGDNNHEESESEDEEEEIEQLDREEEIDIILEETLLEAEAEEQEEVEEQEAELELEF